MRGRIVRSRLGLVAGVALLIGAAAVPGVAIAAPSHGLSLFGDLKYGPDFEHFEYANPSAPKGGKALARSDNPPAIRSTPPVVRIDSLT